ncbi:MAG: zinc ribbon domain-containing protein [Gammaproteobacteria bacterium]|nr:zinc ribbon domain-containing protein [Gammaproteobacteria bacterium]
MPIYEYQCTKCEHKLEALQKMSDNALLDCPACGKPSLVKLISAVSFRLKGGGWYETDFKTGNKKQLAESESAAPSNGSSDKTDGGKSDSPPSKGDGKASAGKETTKNKTTDNKKAPSKASPS